MKIKKVDKLLKVTNDTYWVIEVLRQKKIKFFRHTYSYYDNDLATIVTRMRKTVDITGCKHFKSCEEAQKHLTVLKKMDFYTKDLRITRIIEKKEITKTVEVKVSQTRTNRFELMEV